MEQVLHWVAEAVLTAIAVVVLVYLAIEVGFAVIVLGALVILGIGWLCRTIYDYIRKIRHILW